MNTLLSIVLSAGIISLISFVGVILAFKKINVWFFKNTKFLVTFAAGVFLMTSIGLVGETFEFLTNQKAVLAIVGGFLGMLILHKILPETHHHHDKECPTCIPKKSSTKLVIGDIIHNAGDGIVLVVAFSISPEIGIITSVSVLIHEVIQELSEYIVLRNSGYSTKKTLMINFLSALSIFIGVIIGLYLTQETEFQAVLLGISAGIFLHIVFHDLFPYSAVRKISEKSSWKHLVIFSFGILLMFGIGQIIPHTHEHKENHTELLEHAHDEFIDEHEHNEHTH